ncbi:MAG: hypothetical protein P8Z72_16295 [Gammaproteobacteria bacterium]
MNLAVLPEALQMHAYKSYKFFLSLRGSCSDCLQPLIPGKMNPGKVIITKMGPAGAIATKGAGITTENGTGMIMTGEIGRKMMTTVVDTAIVTGRHPGRLLMAIVAITVTIVVKAMKIVSVTGWLLISELPLIVSEFHPVGVTVK